MAEKATKYCFSTDNEHFTGSYDSVEEADRAAIEENNLENDQDYWVGEEVPYVPHVDADQVIDQACCSAQDHAGEAAEEWLAHLPKEEVEKLEQRLTKVFQEWLVEVGHEARFFGVHVLAHRTVDNEWRRHLGLPLVVVE
jgi:hypothetical protein